MLDRRPVQYSIDLLLWMTKRELMVRYRHAFLGFFWVIVNPLLQVLTLGLLFRFFSKVNIENYYTFLFLGLLPWNFFAQSILQTTTVIVYNRNLLTKAAFPKELLVLATVFAELTHFIVALMIVLLFLFLKFPIGLTNLLWVLLATFWLTCFTMGMGLLTSSATVWFRDVQFLVKSFVPLWFYATPILYTTDMIPRTFRNILVINPMVGILEIFRFGFFSTNRLSASELVVQIVISLLVVISGILLFKRSMPFFIDRI